MRYRFLASVMWLAITAASVLHVPEAQASKSNEQPIGVLFGTYTRGLAKEHFRNESLLFRRVGDRKVRSVGIKLRPFGKVPSDFTDVIECGSLFYFELPAGDYEFFDCSLTQDTLGGPFTYSADRKFSVRFKVEAGKANYLGSIHIFKRMSAFRTPLSGAGHFAFTYQEERDWSLLRRLHPEMELPIIDGFPAGGDVPEFIQLIRKDAEQGATDSTDEARRVREGYGVYSNLTSALRGLTWINSQDPS